MDSGRLIARLLNDYSIISDQVDRQELSVILRMLAERIDRDVSMDAVVEFGCYIGTTSLFIRRLLDAYSHPAVFHVYDSFTGLPEKTGFDTSPLGESFRPGELAASRKAFEQQFKKAGLRSPVIHKGWFSGIEPANVPAGIGFAYLDGDYYESIRDSLRLITPRLTPGACIVVDDYANEALPGASRAVDEWLRGRGVAMRIETSLAIITVR